VQTSRLRWSLLTSLTIVALIATAGGSASGATSTVNAVKAVTIAPAALYSVSCTSATFCMAVGGTPAPTTQVAVAESWDGVRWQRLPVPTPPFPPPPPPPPPRGPTPPVAAVPVFSPRHLDAVSCPSSTECVAVGQENTGTLFGDTWTAATGWTLSQPLQAGGRFSGLYAISCPTTSLCFAAGSEGDIAGAQSQPPLVERWTAGTWTLEKISAPAGTSSLLYGISCPSAGQCTAVGGLVAGTVREGLIEQLSGGTWTARPAPGSQASSLYGVSCPTTTACEAVGQTPSGALAEGWAGGSWVPSVPATPRHATGPGLDGVSCASATHCVATGVAPFTGFSQVAFIDMSNPSWALTAQTGSGFGITGLNAVSCWSTATTTPSCALVGDTTTAPETLQPLSAFLTGTKWTIVPTV